MRRLLTLALVLICLAVAAPAQARIVINERIGAARLSLSDNQVIDRFGKLNRVTHRETDFGGPRKTFHYFARKLRRKLSGERCHVQGGDGACQVVHHQHLLNRKTVFSFTGGRVAAVTIRYLDRAARRRNGTTLRKAFVAGSSKRVAVGVRRVPVHERHRRRGTSDRRASARAARSTRPAPSDVSIA